MAWTTAIEVRFSINFAVVFDLRISASAQLMQNE
jgi:hypothetical protein